MIKTLLILVIGIVIGYSYGYKDARLHDRDVLTRTIDRVGGANRGKYNQDIDKTMDKVGR